MRVIVVGAGLGGLTLANGLRRAGIEVAVYERDGARGRPQGISIHLDERGASALRACLPSAPAAMVAATLGGGRTHASMLSEVDGALAVADIRAADGESGRPLPGRQAHRPLLRAILLTGLADVVRFGTELTRFEHRADGTVKAWFADGGTDTADVLVGADGIGSTVRRDYLPQVRVTDTGRRMLMGATPLRAVLDTGLPDLIGDNPASVMVRGTMMAMGVLRFTEPPVTARKRWLPALPADAVTEVENYVMWALPCTRERLGSADAPAEVYRLAEELAENLPSAPRSVVANAWPDVTVPLRIGMIPPMPAWPVSPVTVIGDAIHLAPGFGANLAMRDAHNLCTALVDADRGRRDLLDAIGTYENTMRETSFRTPAAAKAGA
ncbi:FAD-dependent oxidoreductase [Actinophytocola sediminis]